MNALRWEGLPEIDPCVVRCGSGPPGYGTHQDGHGRHGVRGHGHGSHHGMVDTSSLWLMHMLHWSPKSRVTGVSC